MNFACRQICARNKYSDNLTYQILLWILGENARHIFHSLAIQDTTCQQVISSSIPTKMKYPELLMVLLLNLKSFIYQQVQYLELLCYLCSKFYSTTSYNFQLNLGGHCPGCGNNSLLGLSNWARLSRVAGLWMYTPATIFESSTKVWVRISSYLHYHLVFI